MMGLVLAMDLGGRMEQVEKSSTGMLQVQGVWNSVGLAAQPF